jgi:adenine-specific DNA-methyltransferase
MEKLKMHSPNLTQDNIARIRDLFPGCVTEAKGEDGSVKLAVDFDQLRQELADSIVEGPQERYHLNWPGKREALLMANAPIAKTLRPCREESVDFDATKNLFIEGDNLDALKLLQETYLGKVKMIYIDPPYNTGNDFIYEDDFAASAEEFLTRSNQKDERGNRLVSNTEANGRFHSDWLTMLFPRLRLARNLLSDDGVIFLSIDDEELVNLRKCCDEIFGEDNFVDCLVWKKLYGGKNDSKWFLRYHDYVLVYAKDKNIWRPNLLPRTDKQDSRYKNPDNDPRGPWKSGDFTGVGETKSCRYQIISPSGKIFFPTDGKRWISNQDKFEELRKDNRIWFGPNGDSTPSIKRFLSEVKDGVSQSTILDYSEVGHSDGANRKLKELLGGGFFDYPKPVDLIKRLIHLGTNGDEIVLDFFAGSATTAHAVMQLNAEDGSSRQFMMVQLPEICDEKSEAFNAGYNTIAEISKQRIRLAGKRVLEGEYQKGWNKDIGFRVLKVDTSNMADVYYAPDALDKAKFDLFIDNIKPDRTPEDLLFQVMLDWGVDLALPITKQSIQGKDVFFVDSNALAACFDASGSIDEAFVNELAKHLPLRVVFRDAGYKNSAVKINVEQIFKLLSPATEVKCI